MKTISVYDPALCCSTGVCGPDIDPALTEFAADVDWAKRQGGNIIRFNLAQQPMAFVDNPVVKLFLERSGQDALPLVLLGDEVVLAGRYPKRTELIRWFGLQVSDERQESVCCGGKTSCC